MFAHTKRRANPSRAYTFPFGTRRGMGTRGQNAGRSGLPMPPYQTFAIHLYLDYLGHPPRFSGGGSGDGIEGGGWVSLPIPSRRSSHDSDSSIYARRF